MQDTSTIDIDLSAIDHNMSVIRRTVGPGCALCPIVKADAYGLGVARVARRLVGAGAQMLAVYSLRQAMETAAAVNGAVPVLVLMPVTTIAREDELVRLMLAGQLHLVVHDEANLAALEACAISLGVVLPVHVEVDVGMSRGGALPDEAVRIISKICQSSRFSLCGVFAHFSHARTDAALTARQLESYDYVIAASRGFMSEQAFERLFQHVASTYTLARDARYHRTMVRFGVAWLGYGLDELEASSPVIERAQLRPVVRWSTTIVQAKAIPRVLRLDTAVAGLPRARRRSRLFQLVTAMATRCRAIRRRRSEHACVCSCPMAALPTRPSLASSTWIRSPSM